MITHGNKQISEIVYARKASEGGGAVRLTNIIRGAQVVFGDLYPALWWLTGATNTAILAAFGQTDCKAVIKATNAYLTALAATDPTKASALAGFINEDPMLVCSLGLEPQGVAMPIRTLNGDRIAYINTGVYANKDTGFDVSLIPTDSSNDNCGMLSGSRSGNDAGLELYYWNRVWLIISNNATRTGVSVQVGKRQRIIRYGVNWSVYINDALAASGTRDKAGAFTSNSPICLYLLNRNNSKSYIGKPKYISAKIMQDGGEVLRDMYPFIRQGANGMIDIISGTFYPNANTSGSFSIEYTLPDGTPWTPLNKTP